MFAKIWALRAGVMGLVLIRAFVEVRTVRTGPTARDTGGGLEAGAMGTLEIGGGVATVAVIGLRV